MTPFVKSVIVPTVDWTSLLSFTKQALSRHIAAPFDKAKREIKYSPNLLPMLSELESPGASLNEYCPRNHEHLVYGFLVICDKDTYIELISSTNLVQTYTQERDFFLIILSGNLLQWSNAIQEGQRDNHSHAFKLVVGEVRKFLESQEFRITQDPRLLKCRP